MFEPNKFIIRLIILAIFEPIKQSIRLMYYNWQQPSWPNFTYDEAILEDLLFAFANVTGQMSGVLNILSKTIMQEALIEIMVLEAIKTSEIEGDYVSRQDVFSSIQQHFGLPTATTAFANKAAQGVSELMIAVRNSFEAPLTAETLFEWHQLLLQHNNHIQVGKWRTSAQPMQIISGAIGKLQVHFEAPPSAAVPSQMAQFIAWFNQTAPNGKHAIKKAPIRAAIAHLYFESIHPFEDGNGRIGRAIAEKALAQTMGSPILLSLSKTIEANKALYYGALQQGQRTNNITAWIQYFVQTLLTAQLQATELVNYILKKTRFFDTHKNSLNERQLKAINKMLDAGPEGFKGGMTARKYQSITKTSKATATRDLQLLQTQGILQAFGGGRNINYCLKFNEGEF